MYLGIPWWPSGWGSACQRRAHGFDPCIWLIPHATEQQSPRATIAAPTRHNNRSPHALEPVLCNRRSHQQWEAQELQLQRSPPTPRPQQLEEAPHNSEDPARPKINKCINKSLKILKTAEICICTHAHSLFSLYKTGSNCIKYHVYLPYTKSFFFEISS